MKKYKNKIFALVGLLVLFFVSYIRQSLFLVINAIINGDAYNYSNYAPPQWLTDNFSSAQLMTIKWPLTIVFIVLFMGITVLFLNFIFHNKRLNIYVFVAFTFLMLCSFLLYGIGWLSGSFSNWYFWSHQLAMLSQSPLIYMICLPTVWYYQKSIMYQ